HFRPITFFLPTILFLGCAYYQFRQPNIDAFHIAFYNDRNYDLLITGCLVEPPDYRDTYTNLKLRVEAVDTGDGDLPVDGFILVRVFPNQIYEYGERLRIRGRLKTPPENEDFSYKEYLARQSIYSYVTKAEVTRLPGNNGNIVTAQVYKLKLKLLENTYRLFQDPEASLFAGILFGVDTGLPKKLQESFKNTGTAHIIAISGFNIAIIAGVLFSTFKYIFNQRMSALLAIFGIFFYAFLVGGDSAVMRAAFMGSIALFARQIGRRNAGLNALGVVAFIMALINPLVLWDVGFQLSFFATLGLILYAEPFSNFTESIIAKFSKNDTSTFVKLINENFILTLAAQLTTIPIMVYHFNRISFISFIANPFILPVQPAVMILGGLSVFISLIIYPIGQLMAWFAWAFAAYTIRIVEFFDKVPNGVMVLSETSSQLILLIYFPLLYLTFNWSGIKERFLASTASLRAAALTIAFVITFVCMIVFWRSSATAGDGRFHITFLEVGSADAVLIQTPEGRNILINGGASATELSDELGRRLPFFSPKLDWLIIASTQENQLSALPRVLERYPPENVLLSGNIQASFSAQTLDKYFANENIPVTRAETGQRLKIGKNAYIEIQAEGPRGSVLLIQYQNFCALLPIGIDESTYEILEFGNTIGKVDVLLLADSGYAPSNPADLFENLTPQLVILSVAAGDPDGLPSQEVLDSLEGFSLLRTDRNGWIDISTNGFEMRVIVERGN
ncbi:MAG: ComEC/Rec2 family competence protein, partial [Anaerolineales bacterium]